MFSVNTVLWEPRINIDTTFLVFHISQQLLTEWEIKHSEFVVLNKPLSPIFEQNYWREGSNLNNTIIGQFDLFFKSDTVSDRVHDLKSATGLCYLFIQNFIKKYWFPDFKFSIENCKRCLFLTSRQIVLGHSALLGLKYDPVKTHQLKALVLSAWGRTVVRHASHVHPTTARGSTVITQPGKFGVPINRHNTAGTRFADNNRRQFPRTFPPLVKVSWLPRNSLHCQHNNEFVQLQSYYVQINHKLMGKKCIKTEVQLGAIHTKQPS